MKPLFAISLSVLAASFTLGGDATKSDLKFMDGTWKAVIVEMDGKPAGDKEKSATFKLVIKDGKYSVYIAEKQLTQGSLKLDGGKKPKEVDAMDGGEFKGGVQKGLYEIMGDEMRITFAEPGQDRPKDFKTAKGETLLHYTRLKEVKK